MPTIIGYIITGIIIAYLFWLHEEVENVNLKLIAEFWIVFLMFTIGLEFSIKHLLKMKRDVFLIGWLQFIITSAIFYFFMYYFWDFWIKTSLIIATAFSMSSTAIVLKVLNENGEINKEYGQKSLWILLFQDLAVIPVLLMIAIFSKIDMHVSILLWKTVLGGITLVLLMFLVWKYFLRPFLEKVSHTNSNEIFIGAILFIVMGASYASHALGLSYSLWALLAGIMIAETHFKHQIEADLIPFRDLLLGIFFVTVGMQLNFSIIFENIGTILSFLCFLILIKILVIYGILRFSTKKITAIKTSLSLFQFWEFWIVIFELASSGWLIGISASQILIVTIIISMILTPFVLKNINFLSDIFLYEKSKENDWFVGQKFSKHIILIGYGRLGKIVAEQLEKNGYPYIIIERDPKTFEYWKKREIPIIYWNAAQKHILESVNVWEAEAVIVSVGQNERLYLVCEAITKLAPKAKIIVKVNKYEEQEMLSNLNISDIIVECEETAISMIEKLKKL